MLFLTLYFSQAIGQLVEARGSSIESGTIKTASSSSYFIVEGVEVPTEIVPEVFKKAIPGTKYIAVGCICVKMPCPCDEKPKYPIIFGVSSADLIKVTSSTKKSVKGYALKSFAIKNDAIIKTSVMSFVNSNSIGKVDIYKAAGIKPAPQSTKSNPVYKVNAVVNAFTFGWKVGTFIDEQLDISGQLASWACKTFGPCN